jgi:hypothetical protein
LSADPDESESDAIFFGDTWDLAGERLDGGDFDGDGYADFVVSAAYHSTDEATTVGAFYVVFGQEW